MLRMEGEPGYLSGVRGGVCSREEKKRRKMMEEAPSSQHRNSGVSSASSGFQDDRSSAASGLDVVDRLTYLEQRMQMQEDEIQLLKMALADVLKRLNISEEHQAAGRRAAGLRARPVSLALPSRPPMVASPLKKCPTMPSCSTARSFSPTPPRSGLKSPPGSVKDVPCKTKARPASAASKKTPEVRWKEPAESVGTRRVTHCKVTMQIYLSPLARKTGFSEAAASAAAAAQADRGPTPGHPQARTPRPEERKTPTPCFTLNLQKTSQSSTQDLSSYKSPTKSPSQYFQICY
uniref:Echinoderm microtubule-associated protein-like 1 n=1 Tax=Oryzias sinensis TaxID=183150 RepID=A0A8C7WMI7_9TELE